MPTTAIPTVEQIPGTVAPQPGVAVPAAPQDGFAQALATQTPGVGGDGASLGGPAAGAAATSPGPAAVRAGFDPARLQTVSLGVMVGAMVDGNLPPGALDPAPAATGAGAGVASPARVGDAWGVSADRPAGVAGAGAAVIDAGERYLGVPYKWGGTSASTGFDCSGFVQQVYADLGISLPRVSVDQSRAGTEVPGGLSAAQPGDLIFWRGNGSRPNHIGIYAGDNTMLVAPRTGDVVRYQEITRPPDAVRRVL